MLSSFSLTASSVVITKLMQYIFQSQDTTHNCVYINQARQPHLLTDKNHSQPKLTFRIHILIYCALLYRMSTFPNSNFNKSIKCWRLLIIVMRKVLGIISKGL